MYLTYQIMISELSLGALDMRDYSRGSNPCFRAVELYSNTYTDPSSDILYIATLDDAAHVNTEQTLSFLCVCEGALPSVLITKDNIAIASSGVSITELANRASRIFTNLNQWIINMQTSVIEREGVQALLDLSYPLFRNPVGVMDLTYKLLAYTQNESLEDGMHTTYTALEAYCEGMAKQLKMDFCMETYTAEPVISTYRSIAPCVTIKKSFKLSGSLCLHTVMLCSDRDSSQGLVDLFCLLGRFIEEYVKHGYPYDGKYSAFDALLQDFLSMRLCDPEEISLRASRVSLPCHGLFNLYKVVLTDAVHQPMAYLAMHLQNRMPHSYVSFYEKSIVILNLYAGAGAVEDTTAYNLDIVKSLLDNRIHCIGVSNQFSQLHEIRMAFHQAEASLVAGTHNAVGFEVEPAQSRPPVYIFEEFYLDYMLLSLRGQQDGIYDNSFARQTLVRLLALGAEQNYNYIGFLQTYLLAERRPSVVGRQLHLHRNTVIYHIHKVEDALGFPLEEPQARLKLILEISRYLLDHPPKKEPKKV